MRRTLIYILCVAVWLAMMAKARPDNHDVTNDDHGVGIRLNDGGRNVYFVFSADSAFEGAGYALDAMLQRGCKGSFFLTGRFLRDTANHDVVERIISEGHYLGPHSDQHLLLAEWDDARTPLVAVDSLISDTRANLAALAHSGVDTAGVNWYMPPYEWASACHAHTVRSMGMTPIAPTPGILTYRDYTTPDMDQYFTSDSIHRQLLDFEATHGLSGAIVIVHLGTHPLRKDKFYNRFPQLLDTLSARGYTMERLP